MTLFNMMFDLEFWSLDILCRKSQYGMNVKDSKRSQQYTGYNDPLSHTVSIRRLFDNACQKDSHKRKTRDQECPESPSAIDGCHCLKGHIAGIISHS